MEDNVDILTAYLRVTHHMSQRFRSCFGRLRLTFPQALVLHILGTGGPLPISELAERMGSANSTVSGIVDQLEKLDLARRERSERDRRVIYVSAADRYHTVCSGEKTDIDRYFSSMLDTMTGKEKTELLSALERLDTALVKCKEKGE